MTGNRHGDYWGHSEEERMDCEYLCRSLDAHSCIHLGFQISRSIVALRVCEDYEYTSISTIALQKETADSHREDEDFLFA